MANNDHVIPIKNTIFSEITANLSSSATSITVKTWEWALFEEWMIATIEQLNSDEKATKREVVLITGINSDTLTITRWYATCVMDDTVNPKVVWNTAQSFTSGAKISVYISKWILNAIQDVLPTSQAYNTCVYNQSVALKNCVLNNCDNWWDALYKEKAERCYNDCGFGDWSLWDCVIDTDTFLDANCNYNFKNLTICEDVVLRFCWAWTPRINVQRKFCNMWTIDLRWWTYVWACSKTDWITGCTVSNNYCQTCYNVMCFGCGWAWWFGCWWSHYWSAWCNANWSSWWDGWKWWTWHYCYRSSSWSSSESYDTEWWAWWIAIWYNWWSGWEWGGGWWSYGWDATSANYAWWGWWGWGWYRTWSWWNWWKWWYIYKWVLSWQWWAWWNGWVFGRWWDWWNPVTNSNSNTIASWPLCWWKWWNGYLWWTWWYWGDYSVSASNPKIWWNWWNWWMWIVCWWNWGNPHKWWTAWFGWAWWTAINNMYGLILHACEYYNNCIEAQWWKWWDWWSAEAITRNGCPRWWCWWVGWNWANWWKVSVAYIKLSQAWNVNTQWWCWWCWWIHYWINCCYKYVCDYWTCRASDWTNWTDGWYKICKPF